MAYRVSILITNIYNGTYRNAITITITVGILHFQCFKFLLYIIIINYQNKKEIESMRDKKESIQLRALT